MKYVFAFTYLIGWFIIATLSIATIFPAIVMAAESDFFSFPERLLDKVIK
jgi:hypothetical protein